MSILEAISPTARELLSSGEVRFFSCTYTWLDPVFGELTGYTVIMGVDAEAALQHFRSQNVHLTSATITN